MDILQRLSSVVETQKEKNTAYRAYTENDSFKYHGKETLSVLDFWRFKYCQLSGQSAEIAEFFVSKALGIDKAENVNYWSAYDISYRGRRIEVKETKYVHPWNHKRVSEVRTFSIAPTKNEYWNDGFEKENKGVLSRQNDIYVFCLNTNRDIMNPDPLNMDDWEFYIIPTFRINAYAGNMQKTISLNEVKKLSSGAVCFDGIKEKVDQIIEDVDQFLIAHEKTK